MKDGVIAAGRWRGREGAAATMSGGAPRTGRRARSRTDGHTRKAGEGEERGRGKEEEENEQTPTGNASGLEGTAESEEFASQASRLQKMSGTHTAAKNSYNRDLSCGSIYSLAVQFSTYYRFFSLINIQRYENSEVLVTTVRDNSGVRSLAWHHLSHGRWR